MGDKTIAIDAFEGNNLVLIDEGHRGASGGEEGAWMRFRNALCEKGFSFEYSPTFGQAVKGKRALTDLYAKTVLIDYSYRYFYADGFGKDYQILNLDEGTRRTLERVSRCLLARIFSAATPLPGAEFGVPSVQHKQAPVDFCRRQRHEGARITRRLGHHRDTSLPRALCVRPCREYRSLSSAFSIRDS